MTFGKKIRERAQDSSSLGVPHQAKNRYWMNSAMSNLIFGQEWVEQDLDVVLLLLDQLTK